MQICPHPVDGQELIFPACDYISGEQFKVVRCSRCEQVVTTPVPADIGRYYPGGYYGDAGGRRFPAVMEWLQEKMYSLRARRVLAKVKNKNARVLDIGCGRGLLLRAFQQNGCDVLGTEFSDDACRFAREKLNIPVRVGLLHDLNFPDQSFDVVTMWHVLEHVSDPRPTLAEVSRILRPGGVFMVGVPNFGSLEARLTKAGWFHLDMPRHLSHHTRGSLERSLKNAGLQPAWASYLAPEYDCFSFVQSLLNRLGVQPNLLYNLLRGRRAKVMDGRSRFGSFCATVLLAPVLGLISLPATVLLSCLGQGAAITICAVKENPDSARKLP
ncbi:MAG TPA: class I SAM-dependent methyltransferase [Verrucomicrobiae bacterium]|jgi:SAM-dependent methyltransferase